ncbi:MAG: hypothetical protein JRF63_00845 [Deltaproteobacteria bacterium]|nr:hypothetical protein [Deltaproteobacteria bacterium]
MKRDYPDIDVNGATWNPDGFDRPAKLPAKTVVDFSRLKIASRLLIGLACLGACAWCVATYIAGTDSVNHLAVVGSGLLAVFGTWFTVVSVYHLLVRRPLMTIDAEGLAFLRYEPIRWPDIRSVAVRVTQPHDSAPALFVKVTPANERKPFEVELTQTKVDQQALVRTLMSYVAAYREAAGLSI